MQMTCPILPRRQFVKTAALLICGVTSVALPGCSLGVMFGKMLTGDPKRLSEFKSMTREDLAKGKRKVLVICTTPESVESELATLKFDLIDGITRMLTQEQTPGPINLGSLYEHSMIDLAKTVIALTGSKSKVVNKPLPTDDPKQRQPDLTLARKYLDWEPAIMPEAGLEKTIKYFASVI